MLLLKKKPWSTSPVLLLEVNRVLSLGQGPPSAANPRARLALPSLALRDGRLQLQLLASFL